MEKITTEEVLDKLDMFQSRFGEIDQFGWWYLERISEDAGKKFTLKQFKEECQTRGVIGTPQRKTDDGRTLGEIKADLIIHLRAWSTRG